MTQTDIDIEERNQTKYKKIVIIVVIYNALAGLASELSTQFTEIQPYSPYIFWLIGNVGLIISIWYNVKIPGVPVTTIEPIEVLNLKNNALDFQTWLTQKIATLKIKILENKSSIDDPEEYQKFLEESIKEALVSFDESQLKIADFVTMANAAWLKCNQKPE